MKINILIFILYIVLNQIYVYSDDFKTIENDIKIFAEELQLYSNTKNITGLRKLMSDRLSGELIVDISKDDLKEKKLEVTFDLKSIKKSKDSFSVYGKWIYRSDVDGTIFYDETYIFIFIIRDENIFLENVTTRNDLFIKDQIPVGEEVARLYNSGKIDKINEYLSSQNIDKPEINKLITSGNYNKAMKIEFKGVYRTKMGPKLKFKLGEENIYVLINWP
jgi:hypothetical protein